MGPLLFLIYYMNDLASVSDTIFPIMFADDIDVFIQIATVVIKSITCWLIVANYQVLSIITV